MPAPVDEQHGLPPAPQAVFQFLREAGAEDGAVAALELAAHVHHLDLGQGTAAHALGKLDERQAVFRAHAGHRTHIRSDGRRGAAQQQHRARALRALPGDLAGVVAGAAVGLVAALVFLIDDEDADIRKRREHRRARADDHARLARADAPPFVEMLSLRKAGMEDGRVRAEALMEPGDHLRREGDLRHEDDGAFAQFQRPAHQADVDLRLARAGDAVQQKTAAAMLQRGAQFGYGAPLRACEGRVGQRSPRNTAGARRSPRA